jgi:predicted N-acyltransferase
MAYSLKVTNSVEQTNPDEWDQLGGNELFSSHRWYRYGEAVLPNDTPYYLTVMDGDQKVARATFWLKKEEALPVASPLVSKWINRIFRRWPLLICSSPLANTGGLILPDSDDNSEIISLMMAELKEISIRERVSFLTFDFVNKKQTEQLSSAGGLHPITLSEPGTRLEIRWSSFKEYLKTLSNSDRKSYRRAVNRAKALGIEVRRLTEVTEIDRAIALIREHDARYKSPTLPWIRRMLENASMVESIWLAAYVGDKLIACGLLLGDRGTWVATALGRDYDYDYAYFVLGYESIRHVIESGGQLMRWGTGAYDYKKRLGFELEDTNYVCFQARKPAVDWIFSKLARILV